MTLNGLPDHSSFISIKIFNIPLLFDFQCRSFVCTFNITVLLNIIQLRIYETIETRVINLLLFLCSLNYHSVAMETIQTNYKASKSDFFFLLNSFLGNSVLMFVILSFIIDITIVFL